LEKKRNKNYNIYLLEKIYIRKYKYQYTYNYYVYVSVCSEIRLEIRFVKSPRLLIKLPVQPSTIDELALIRFWLLKFSQTHFENLNVSVEGAYRGILSPDFLSVLSPRKGPRQILFHANNVKIERGAAIPSAFGRFLCARKVFLRKPLLEKEPHRYSLVKFIIGEKGNATEKVFIHFKPYGSNQEKFCELLVNVSLNSFIIQFGDIIFLSNFADLVSHAHGNRP
jgi:hypothetical protein